MTCSSHTIRIVSRANHQRIQKAAAVAHESTHITSVTSAPVDTPNHTFQLLAGGTWYSTRGHSGKSQPILHCTKDSRRVQYTPGSSRIQRFRNHPSSQIRHANSNGPSHKTWWSFFICLVLEKGRNPVYNL